MGTLDKGEHVLVTLIDSETDLQLKECFWTDYGFRCVEIISTRVDDKERQVKVMLSGSSVCLLTCCSFSLRAVLNFPFCQLTSTCHVPIAATCSCFHSLLFLFCFVLVVLPSGLHNLMSWHFGVTAPTPSLQFVFSAHSRTHARTCSSRLLACGFQVWQCMLCSLVLYTF